MVESHADIPFLKHDRKFLLVLVVENNADLRRSIELSLVTQGHFVMSSETVSTAIELARENEFDLLITNVDLPDGSGRELMTELQQLRETKGIIIYPASDISGYTQGPHSAFNHRLMIPFEMSELKEKLADIIK